jgi:hypothetical protein
LNMIEAEKNIRDAANAVSRDQLSRIKSGYPPKEICEFRRVDMERFCVCGDERRRRALIMELAIRQAEACEKLLVIALNGGYTPLAEYIPQLRLYRVGEFSSVNVFSMVPRLPRYSTVISDIVGRLYDLSRDERGYFMRGVEMAYADGCRAPSMREIGDRLLQIQAEVQPKEAYKVECLKNVLWELESGIVGAMSEQGEGQFTLPAVIDLEQLPTWRERSLVAMVLMLRSLETEATLLVVDPADWLKPNTGGTENGFPLQDWLEVFGARGKGICMSMASATASMGLLGGLTSVIFCGPLWGEDVGFIERAFRLGRGELKGIRGLGEGLALACTNRSRSPFLVRARLSSFRALTPQGVVEHMRLLGEEVKPLGQSKAKRERMLEKIFPDRAALVYAWEVLRLIQSGRVAVESVVQQRNATIKAVVRALKRYFMIVECTDSTGSGCYRLTKAGERAIAEMEGGDESDKGKTCGT